MLPILRGVGRICLHPLQQVTIEAMNPLSNGCGNTELTLYCHTNLMIAPAMHQQYGHFEAEWLDFAYHYAGQTTDCPEHLVGLSVKLLKWQPLSKQAATPVAA